MISAGDGREWSLDHEVRSAVNLQRDEMGRVMEFLHAHPELGHHEHVSARFLAERLRAAGLVVEEGWAGMPTALRAELACARAGRSIGLIMVYDAVPAHGPDGVLTPDHSCGHGAIAAGVVGAARALSSLRTELAGTVVVLGCPSDEIHNPDTADAGGGKARAAESGACDGLDAALYAHPEFIDAVWERSRWMRREEAIIDRPRSLRAGGHRPVHVAVLTALKLSAQSPADIVIERIMSEGDVEDGCRVVTRITFLLFADDEPALQAVADRVHDGIQAARWRTAGPDYPGIEPDPAVASAAREALRAAGRDVALSPPALPFATDFGNITHRVPGALIGVGHQGGWRFHTPEGARQFASEAGLEAAQGVAETLALTAVRLA